MARRPRESFAAANARGSKVAAGMRVGREASEKVAQVAAEAVAAAAADHSEKAAFRAEKQVVEAVLQELKPTTAKPGLWPEDRMA